MRLSKFNFIQVLCFRKRVIVKTYLHCSVLYRKELTAKKLPAFNATLVGSTTILPQGLR